MSIGAVPDVVIGFVPSGVMMGAVVSAGAVAPGSPAMVVSAAATVLDASWIVPPVVVFDPSSAHAAPVHAIRPASTRETAPR